MPNVSKYKLRDSDRSGFTELEASLLKDGPWRVSGEEWDTPAPSKKSLGGESDVSGSPRANSSFESVSNATVVPAGYDNPTVRVGVSGISHSLTHPWMIVAATDSTVNITASPQITRGQQGNVLTLQCVSNRIVLEDGNGLALAAGRAFTMQSGSVISFIYRTDGTVWQETSRSL